MSACRCVIACATPVPRAEVLQVLRAFPRPWSGKEVYESYFTYYHVKTSFSKMFFL